MWRNVKPIIKSIGRDLIIGVASGVIAGLIVELLTR